MFERQAFSALYTIVFCLVVALMLSSAFRMAQIWVDLRQLLIDLERRPVRVAFFRIKGLTWSFWRQGGEDAEWVYMARSLEALGQLGSGSQSSASGLPAIAYFEKKIGELRQNLEEAVARYNSQKDAAGIQAKLQELKSDIASLQSALATGRANPFLTSALVGLAGRLDASLAVAGAPDHGDRLPAALDAAAAKIAEVGSTLG